MEDLSKNLPANLPLAGIVNITYEGGPGGNASIAPSLFQNSKALPDLPAVTDFSDAPSALEPSEQTFQIGPVDGPPPPPPPGPNVDFSRSDVPPPPPPPPSSFGDDDSAPPPPPPPQFTSEQDDAPPPPPPVAQQEVQHSRKNHCSDSRCCCITEYVFPSPCCLGHSSATGSCGSKSSGQSS